MVHLFKKRSPGGWSVPGKVLRGTETAEQTLLETMRAARYLTFWRLSNKGFFTGLQPGKQLPTVARPSERRTDDRTPRDD